MSNVNDTRNAVLARVPRRPVFGIVPEHAQKLFDRVIEETEAVAVAAHPDDVWGRIEFWKEEILSRVSPVLRGLVAVQYHEYVAALMRGDDADGAADPFGFGSRPPYGGEARAQRDAYMACCASL
jgi:hypothetical protein